ncbi:conserved hypothetical protein [Ruegeria lacuscaerulensis ITI-1157]|uniref:Uncharacterized protein n=1 Tax=Ruegeria intermedia TaxID=996115 RepID=A0A1M4T6L3_9RHOB|nr:hypothetical protein [Ruegeria intermedia]EEX10824.1 conserved hypothetical protein [Ruegeria lacuscaerulensis ITI-1157]SHE40091.1 hypothetical protein SAMN05444279_10237 [Ruegeria intermedia]SHK17748.1 hypothetical protein SAMN05444404_3413 [Ruegeria lacuscaerulensis ITI-1157]
MSDTITTLAAKLAEDTMKVMDETGQDRFYVEVGEVLGAASQSLEEAFLTEIRVRLAERKARQFVIRRLSEHRAKLKAIEKK